MPSFVSARYHLFLAFLALSGASKIVAQDTVRAAPAAPVRTVSERERQSTLGLSLFNPFSETPETPFQAGPFVFRPRFSFRYMNAEDMPSGSRRIATEIQTFSPGLAVDLGRDWTFDYAPSWTYYSARAFEDTADQAASLRGAIMGQTWTLELGENFSIGSPTLVETAQQTRTRSWATSVSASRGLGSKIGLQLNADMSEQKTDIAQDTRNWTTQNWLTFQVLPSVNLGFGPGAGYEEISDAPDMTYERAMGRISWKMTDKLSLSGSGGMEFRHSNASDGKTIRYPTANVALSYQPFETTQLSFSYARTLNSSAFRSQVVKGGSWNLDVSQRLLRHLYLSAGWSHQDSTYEAATLSYSPPPAAPLPEGEDAPAPDDRPILISLPGRSDKVDSLSTQLTFQVLKRVSISATYQRTKNKSSEAGFSFNSTQYGFTVGFSF